MQSSLQCCRYNNSRFKHCRDEQEELHASGVTHSSDSSYLPLTVSLWYSLYPSPACLFLFILLLYVLWMEVVDVKRYVLQERGEACPHAQVSVLYGLSFMVAAAGVPLELISGLVFMLVGRALHASKWAWHVGCGARKDRPFYVLQLGLRSTLVGCKYWLGKTWSMLQHPLDK